MTEVPQVARPARDRVPFNIVNTTMPPPTTAPQIGTLLRLGRAVYPGTISQARLAVLSGVRYWTIVSLERGIVAHPRPDDLDRLAAVLNRPELAAVAQALRERPASPATGSTVSPG